MKLEIDLPDPLFKPGDVVYVPHKDNPGGLFLHIERVKYSGEWFARCDGGGWQACQVPGRGRDPLPFYEGAVQHGSQYTHPSGKAFRPGRPLCFLEDRLASARLIEGFEHPIVGADTLDNYQARDEAWARGEPIR